MENKKDAFAEAIKKEKEKHNAEKKALQDSVWKAGLTSVLTEFGYLPDKDFVVLPLDTGDYYNFDYGTGSVDKIYGFDKNNEIHRKYKDPETGIIPIGLVGYNNGLASVWTNGAIIITNNPDIPQLFTRDFGFQDVGLWVPFSNGEKLTSHPYIMEYVCKMIASRPNRVSAKDAELIKAHLKKRAGVELLTDLEKMALEREQRALATMQSQQSRQ